MRTVNEIKIQLQNNISNFLQNETKNRTYLTSKVNVAVEINVFRYLFRDKCLFTLVFLYLPYSFMLCKIYILLFKSKSLTHYSFHLELLQEGKVIKFFRATRSSGLMNFEIDQDEDNQLIKYLHLTLFKRILNYCISYELMSLFQICLFLDWPF